MIILARISMDSSGVEPLNWCCQISQCYRIIIIIVEGSTIVLIQFLSLVNRDTTGTKGSKKQ